MAVRLPKPQYFSMMQRYNAAPSWTVTGHCRSDQWRASEIFRHFPPRIKCCVFAVPPLVLPYACNIFLHPFITGFVAKDAEIRTFTNNDVARFPMAIGRKETKDNATNRVSAFINVEAWRKSGSASFELLKKGTLLTIEGYLKPEEWTDKNGTKQNGIKFVAKKFYEAVEKPEKAEKPQPKTRAKKQKEAA